MAKSISQKELRIIVSETRSGKVIKEKYGTTLLWRKEFHDKHSFFILDINKMICKSCGHLIDAPEPRRSFVKFGRLEIKTLVCELCAHINQYQFKEDVLDELSVSLQTHQQASRPNKKPRRIPANRI